MIPQGLVHIALGPHKKIGEPLEAMQNRASRGVAATGAWHERNSSTEPVDNPVERFPAPFPSDVSQRLFFLPLKF
jgi:hypothetical protein